MSLPAITLSESLVSSFRFHFVLKISQEERTEDYSVGDTGHYGITAQWRCEGCHYPSQSCWSTQPGTAVNSASDIRADGGEEEGGKQRLVLIKQSWDLSGPRPSTVAGLGPCSGISNVSLPS